MRSPVRYAASVNMFDVGLGPLLDRSLQRQQLDAKRSQFVIGADRVLELGATGFISRTDDLGDVARRLVPGGVDAVIDTAVLGITAHDALRGRFGLADAAAAHERFSRGGLHGGRVLITID